MKYQLILLKNESDDDHSIWIKSLEKRKDDLEYSIIDLTKNDWLDKIKQSKFDLLIARPPGVTSLFKSLYDERLYILQKILNYPIYPGFDLCLIYENKRILSYYLKAFEIPHPETNVFYDKDEAFYFLKHACFPIVGKLNIGASGKGVKIIANIDEAKEYVIQVFSQNGINSKTGPNWRKVSIFRRINRLITNPSYYKTRFETYKKIREEKQRGFVLFQEYIPHMSEWRCLRIGGSFFAHKKIVYNNLASGTLLKNYDNPPISLLDFINEYTNKTNITSAAIDCFEKDGKYLVNEIQTYFGQSDPFQMKVDDRIGRYIYKNNKWSFEEGDFNTNESYDLRLQHILEILSNQNEDTFC